MGIEPTLPAWKAGTLPLSYTRRWPEGTAARGRRRRRAEGVVMGPGRWATRLKGIGALGVNWDVSEWVEQDSNLRRLSHQIYSLAPLAAWVSTRVGATRRSVSGAFGRGRAPSRGEAELAVRVELTTVGLQNRCSAD
jgi:hypothetical protein